MHERRVANALACLILAVEALSLYVFVYALRVDWHAGEMEGFELAARVVGYLLALACGGFSAAGAFEYGKSGREGKALPMAGRFALAAVVLLCIHDVLLYMAYGNQLEGTYTMAAFFALDVALLALYLVALRLRKRGPARPWLPVLLGAIVFLWLLYMVGDMAGYPASALYEWDEPLMKLTFLCHALLLLWLTRRGERPRSL